YRCHNNNRLEFSSSQRHTGYVAIFISGGAFMSRFLGIGEQFPEFSVPAVVSLEKGKEFSTISNKDIKGKWAVVFFYPMDFTFVCPTEIAEFNRELKDFKDRDAVVFGAS